MNSSSNIIKFINKKRFDSCKDVFSALSELNYAVIKGEPLSYFAYGKFGMRASSDIDILASKRTICKIEEILNAREYLSDAHSRTERILTYNFSHQVSPWHKKNSAYDDVIFDLNFELFWGEYSGERIDIDDFISDGVDMKIYNTKVKTLPPLKLLIQLMLHHYKDMNSIFLLATRNSINKEMFKDVYYLLINNRDDITLNKLYDVCQKYNIIPYVFYILYYTGQIYNDTYLFDFIDAFRTPTGEWLLNCYGLCKEERKEWRCDFDTRLESDNLIDYIITDLTDRDKEKIAINKRVFMGGL